MERWTAHLLSALVLVVWAVAAAGLPDYLLPSPLAVGKRVIELLANPRFLLNGLFSLWHIGASIAAAFVSGLLLALLMHFAPSLRLVINGRLNPFLSSFSTIGGCFSPWSGSA